MLRYEWTLWQPNKTKNTHHPLNLSFVVLAHSSFSIYTWIHNGSVSSDSQQVGVNQTVVFDIKFSFIITFGSALYGVFFIPLVCRYSNTAHKIYQDLTEMSLWNSKVRMHKREVRRELDQVQMEFRSSKKYGFLWIPDIILKTSHKLLWSEMLINFVGFWVVFFNKSQIMHTDLSGYFSWQLYVQWNF